MLTLLDTPSRHSADLAQLLSPPAHLWERRHILDTQHWNPSEIEQVLAETALFKSVLQRPNKKLNLLEGKAMVNLFYENSTRTSISFELAAKYLGAEVVNFSINTSSVKKGETLDDTVETLIAMGIDAMVLRHPSSGICQQLAQRFDHRIHILNAGDGSHAHPTQAFLDLFTMIERLGSVAGKKITIVGDIKHSRVARSNIHLLNTMGADVHVVGPATLLPQGIESLGCTAHQTIETALDQADVVMCLRLQLERQKSGLIPSLQEYTTLFGIHRDRLFRYAKPDVVLMHPGPMNRGVEITSDVADDRVFSLISDQVTNGVAVRMAFLHLLLQDKA
jgi:aspartate carbamoyltransferase catalytic subunit